MQGSGNMYHVPDGTVFLTPGGPISEKIINNYDFQLFAAAEAAEIARLKSVERRETVCGPEHEHSIMASASNSPHSDVSEKEPLMGWLRRLQRSSPRSERQDRRPSRDFLASHSPLSGQSGGPSPVHSQIFQGYGNEHDPRVPQSVHRSSVQDQSSQSGWSSQFGHHSLFTDMSSVSGHDSLDRLNPPSPTRWSEFNTKIHPNRNFFRNKRTDVSQPPFQSVSGQRLDVEDGDRRGIEVGYVVGRGLTSCEDFTGMSNLQTLWLAGNKIFSLQPLATLERLRLIDASCNSIQFFPIKPGQNEIFKSLSMLFLHDNLIQRLSSLEGMTYTHQLRIATLHGNPCADLPTYRSSTFDLCPTLQVLDGSFIAELDVAKTALTRNMLVNEHQKRLKRYQHNLAVSLPADLTDVSRATLYEEHIANLDLAIRAMHHGFGRSRPTVVLQRVFRGHQCRVRFRRLKMAFAMPVLAMQRWMLKAWVAKYLVVPLQGCHSSAQRDVRACLASLPLQPWTSTHASRLCSSALYFLPEDALMVSSLVAQSRSLFADPPSVLISDIALLRAAPASACSVRGNPFIQGLLVRHHHRSRSLATASALSQVKLDAAALRFHTIRRHGFTSNAAERSAFKQGFESEPRRRTVPGCSVREGEQAFLLAVTFSTRSARALFVRIIANLNRHFFALPADAFTGVRGGRAPIRIRHILAEALARKVAGCAITSAARAWMNRRWLRPSIGTAFIMVRAARCVQAWWRWRVVFRLRMACLTLLKTRVDAINERTLYCLSPHVRQRVSMDRRAGSLIRESRIRMNYDEDRCIRLAHRPAASMVFHGDSSSSPIRALLPEWVGVCVAAPDAGAEQQEPLGKVLSLGSEVDFLRLRRRSTLAGDDYAGARLPRRKLMGKQAVLRVRFASCEEGRARMAVLLLRTYRAAERDPLLLLTAAEARASLYAILIQACFRGFLARRWFRSIFTFVVNGLGTTFVVERARSLSSKRQRPPQYLVSPAYAHARAARSMNQMLRRHSDEAPLERGGRSAGSMRTVEHDGAIHAFELTATAKSVEPELSVTGQPPATGGRWAGKPNVTAWQEKRDLAGGMREENLEDKYELDVRNLTDEHLKRWRTKSELQRRKVVAKVNERGKKVSLRALGQRPAGTASKMQKLQEESSREQIHSEKARRQWVATCNQNAKIAKLHWQRGEREADRLTLEIAMQMRALPNHPIAHPRPQTSFGSLSSSFSGEFGRRPHTGPVDARAHLQFSGHFRSSASLLAFHETRLLTPARAPLPASTAPTPASTRPSSRASAARPSSREQLRARKHADAQRLQQQHAALAADSLARAAASDQRHAALRASSHHRPSSSHLSFFDYPWTRAGPSDSASSLHLPLPDPPNAPPTSPPLRPKLHSASPATHSTNLPPRKQPPRDRAASASHASRGVGHSPSQRSGAAAHPGEQEADAERRRRRPMSTPAAESAGRAVASEAFERPQWQIVLKVDADSESGSGASTRAWTPEEPQPQGALVGVNAGGALRLRAIRGDRSVLAPSVGAGEQLLSIGQGHCQPDSAGAEAWAGEAEGGWSGEGAAWAGPAVQRLQPRAHSAPAKPAPTRPAAPHKHPADDDAAEHTEAPADEASPAAGDQESAGEGAADPPDSSGGAGGDGRAMTQKVLRRRLSRGRGKLDSWFHWHSPNPSPLPRGWPARTAPPPAAHPMAGSAGAAAPRRSQPDMNPTQLRGAPPALPASAGSEGGASYAAASALAQSGGGGMFAPGSILPSVWES